MNENPKPHGTLLSGRFKSCDWRALRWSAYKPLCSIEVSHELRKASFGLASTPKPDLGLHLPELVRDDTWLLCNTISSNFVRANGFVIQNSQILTKHSLSIPLDGTTPISLDGTWDVWNPENGQIHRISLDDDQVPPLRMGIQGPRLLHNSQSLVRTLRWRHPKDGPTIGPELNFDPIHTRTAWTIFGQTSTGDPMALSCFAPEYEEQPWGRCYTFSPACLGLEDIIELALDLEMTEAILGGGSADCQQYIAGDGLWTSRARPQAHRVEPVWRKLGAVLHLRNAIATANE